MQRIIYVIENNINTTDNISYISRIYYTMSSSSETSSPRLVGQVKWFNNKAGYGFITVSDGDYSGKDIFIHYSTIRVTNSQYKYLVQGEYVEFEVEKSSSDTHEYQASSVTGIKGGKLMCEMRALGRLEQGVASSARRYNTRPESADGFTKVTGRRRPASRRGDSQRTRPGQTQVESSPTSVAVGESSA